MGKRAHGEWVVAKAKTKKPEDTNKIVEFDVHMYPQIKGPIFYILQGLDRHALTVGAMLLVAFHRS